MKTKNLLLLLTVGGMMIFASCKKDDSTPTPLTKDEATVSLNNVNGSYATDMTAYQAAPEVQLADDIDDLGLPFNTSPFKASNFQKEIQKKYSHSRALKGEDYLSFPWAENVGTWTYNTSTLKWEQDKNSTTQVIVIFSYNGATNNGKLTYYDYATKTATYNGESVTYMSQLKAKVEINNVVKHTWTYTATLGGSLTSMSLKMGLAATYGTSWSHSMSASMSATANLSSSSSTISATALEELKKDGAIVLATSFSVKMTEAQSGTTMVANASYRIKDIIIKWALNGTSTTNYSGDPSKFMTVSVWTADGAKVADVIFTHEGDLWVPYLKFTDGTTAPVSTYFKGDLYDDIYDFGGSFWDLGF